MSIEIRNTQVPGLAPRRKARGLSQEALGALIGHGRLAVLRWENGQQAPPLKTLARIAEVLECQTIDLLQAPDQQAS